MEDDEIEEVIAFLEECGALVWVGMDQNGERLFQFNLDILKEELPEMYESIMEDLDAEMLHLFQAGLIEVEYDENLNSFFNITEAGKKVLRDNGFIFPEENDE